MHTFTRRKLSIFLPIFTLFWCGLTGAFAVWMGGAILKHQDAEKRFQSTQGVVLSSRIESHTTTSDGRTSTTYSPEITYRYEVDGKTYTSSQYAYGMGSTSEYGYVSGLVERHPAGKKIPVYYDPDDPAEAILQLEAPAVLYFMLLFLQPFLAVGVGMISGCLYLPVYLSRIKSFSQRAMTPPCHIPSWGQLRPEMSGFAIRKKRKPVFALAAAAGGYALACFASIFLVGFFFDGFGDPDATIVRNAFFIAGGVGVLAAIGWLVLPAAKATLFLDPGLGSLSLTSAKRNVQLSFDRIESWGIRQVQTPLTKNRTRTVLLAPLLLIRTVDGEEVPIHLFGSSSEGPELARKVGEGFAALTNRPFAEPEPEAPEPLKLSTDLCESMAVAREILKNYKELADLR